MKYSTMENVYVDITSPRETVTIWRDGKVVAVVTFDHNTVTFESRGA